MCSEGLRGADPPPWWQLRRLSKLGPQLRGLQGLGHLPLLPAPPSRQEELTGEELEKGEVVVVGSLVLSLSRYQGLGSGPTGAAPGCQEEEPACPALLEAPCPYYLLSFVPLLPSSSFFFF